MPDISLQALVDQLKQKRGGQGIRKVAEQIGISAATLSRVERGHLPDLETFGKICNWLQMDPKLVLNVKTASPRTSVHFKKEQTLRPATASALADLIVAAQKQMREEEAW